MKVFLASYQVVKRAADVPGPHPRDEYRRDVADALIVAGKPEELTEVIAASVKLQPGEHIEVIQWKQIEPGEKVFVVR